MRMFVYSEVTSNDIILSSSMGTFLKRGRILGVVIFISSFSRDFTTSSIVAMISLFGIVLEESEKLRHFARRSVSVRVNFLKALITALATAVYQRAVKLFYFVQS